MKIQSILAVPASRALAVLHTGKDFLKAIPRIYWVAAIGISLLAGIYYRFSTGRKGSLPLIPVETDSLKEEMTFEYALSRYQKLNALLEIIKDLKELINLGDNKKETKANKLQKVKTLYENWDFFKQSLLKKDKTDPCLTFIESPIANPKIQLLTAVEESIKAAQQDLQKVLDEKKPDELKEIEFVNGDMYSGIYCCECLRKKLGKTVQEKQFYPRFFFDNCRKLSDSSMPSSDFMKYAWQQIIIVSDPLQQNSKEAFILNVELPLLADVHVYEKLPGNALIDRFVADQKTMNTLIYSKV